MTKAESSKRGTGTPRGKGLYIHQACTVCRQKKCRCDGKRPVCQACINDGRADECAWTGEVARPPRTEAHFKALRKRVEALKELESLVEKNKQVHGGVWADADSYLQLRPSDADGDDLPDSANISDKEEAGGANPAIFLMPSSAKPSGALWSYGSAAVFRFAPETASATSRFPELAQKPETSYTLLVDGADTAHHNHHLDWARYLLSAVPLDRREHDKWAP